MIPTLNLSDKLPVPRRMSHLPIQNGYVVPWFVALVDGKYDFRIVENGKMTTAIKYRKCWLCGDKMGTYQAFMIGPMCAITQTISEPPSHQECAEYAVKICPFLAQRQDDRRSTDLPENIVQPAGIAIKRQPGAVGIWITKKWSYFKHGNGLLFSMGKPEKVLWYAHGRSATRAEVLESIESGYHLLIEAATIDGEAGLTELSKRRIAVNELLPGEN